MSRPSPVHRLPAECKLLALLCFVLVVVATPRTAYLAFAGYALLLVTVLTIARVRPGQVIRRMVVETPVLVFAILLPFIATGPRVELFGVVAVSEPGLLGSWNVLAKATLGVAGSVLLALTTERRELLAGLERLRLPAQLVQIASFMVRYIDVIAEQLRRMRIARTARCFQGTGVRSWPVLARSAGALFIRTYERGERVHLAMLSRGYAGRLPLAATGPAGATASSWLAASSLPFVAGLIAVTAWWAM